MAKKLICKGQRCLSCLNKAQEIEEDDGLVIVCALELDGYEESDDCEACQQYQVFGEVDAPEEDGSETRALRKTYGDDPGKKRFSTAGGKMTDIVVKKYAFVGDSLAEVKRPREGQDVVELEQVLVEAWNIKVAELQAEVTEQVARLRGELLEKLTAAKQVLIEGNFVDIDEVFVDAKDIEEMIEDDYEDDLEDEDLEDDELEPDEVDDDD